MSLYEKLESYQQEAVKFSRTVSGVGIFFEQGTGKTWATMGIIEDLRRGDVLLIVPLTNIRSTWLKNLSEQLPEWSIALEWSSFKKTKSDRRIFLIHYEGAKRIKNLHKHSWNLAVFDESQRLKNRNSGQSKLGLKLSWVPRRVALTGTPMDGRPSDLWAQFRFIYPSLFGIHWSVFESRYFKTIKINFGEVKLNSAKYRQLIMAKRILEKRCEFLPGMRERFINAIAPYILRVDKREALGSLPPTVVDTPVLLLGSQARVYERLEKDLVVQFKDTRITAPLAVTLIGKLQQVTGGFVIDDDGQALEVGRAKLRKLKAIINRVDPPIVVFCKYRAEMEAVEEVLGRRWERIGMLHGGVKDKGDKLARTGIQDSFQSGRLDALVCQLKTGGVGIDLFAASTAIFYSTSHSYIDHDQAISRIDRRGQTKPVTIFLLRAPNTIDDDIAEAIRSKHQLTSWILNRLRTRRKLQ